MQRADLLAELQNWSRDWLAGSPQHDLQRFQNLQQNLLNWQLDHLPAYQRFARTQTWNPPLLPVMALKGPLLIADYVPQPPPVEFHTSGTTDGQPGVVRWLDAQAYELSLHAVVQHFLIPEPDLRLRFLSLVPTETARPHSSLGHMARYVEQHWGDGQGGWFLHEQLDLAGLQKALIQAVKDEQPVLLVTTSLALQLLLDQWPAGKSLRLPPLSRVMDTGGPKGRKSGVDRPMQHHWLVENLGLDADFIVGEFGMTELSTPRFETTLRARVLGDVPPLRAYSGPPWLRTLVLNPQNRQPVAPGQVGMLAHLDLASLDSPAFLLTADLGRILRLDDGTEVLEMAGRIPGSEWRGCGLDVEILTQ